MAKVSIYSHAAITPHDVRRVSVEAPCDPRVVVKYLHGLPQAPITRERIERALRACKLDHLIEVAKEARASKLAKTNGANGSANGVDHGAARRAPRPITSAAAGSGSSTR